MMEILGSWGYWGLLVASFGAATVFPFSSEAILVGMLLAGGHPWICFVMATLGNWLGGLTSFGIGWIGKTEWLEKWFRVKPQTIQKQKRLVDRYGAWLALLSWLPLIGDVFAIALGFYKAKPLECALWLLVGKALRYAIWLWIF